jgi:hypothetical protein
MQFVGFRSVIGTMWAVDDGETNKITSTFYQHMVEGVWSSGSYPGGVRAEQNDEICGYSTQSADSLYPSRCLVLVYPRSISRFGLLVLLLNILSFISRVVPGPSILYVVHQILEHVLGRECSTREVVCYSCMRTSRDRATLGDKGLVCDSHFKLLETM